MPADLTAITTAITTGFANLTAAVTAGQGAADLAPLVEQVQRVADALYVDTEDESVAELMALANDRMNSVIGPDVNGAQRVRTEPLAP